MTRDDRPGVAAGLLALADLSAGTGDAERARSLLAEAAEVAEASGALAILHRINEARAERP